MGRGASGISNGGDLQGKQGNLGGAPSNVQDLITQRGQKTQEVDEVLAVANRIDNLFGEEGQITQFQTADINGAMGYYDDSGNIAIANKYLNSKGMDAAMDSASKNRFHPSRGNKSGIEAVAAHEYGHALSDKIAAKLGFKDLEAASRNIVEKARKKTSHKTNMGFAERISGYATYNFAECVAEAFGDWYCNGSKSKKESRAVVAVMNNMLKKGGK